MKLLTKMGFKGRLGKHEDGVTRQLEVKVRPGVTGLGFGNFKEATTLKVMLCVLFSSCFFAQRDWFLNASG